MFANFFKIAIRNIVKYKRYSLINILGLSIGLACFLLIMLWVQDEFSYDRFHKNCDNIYMVLRNPDGDRLNAATSKLLAPALKNEFPEVRNATSFIQLSESFKSYLKYEDKGFEEFFGLVDQQFFNIFSFNFIAGDPQVALIDPNSIVLTEKMAKKYYGNENALGKSIDLTLLGQTFSLKVTGILENIPHNSEIRPEIYIPIPFVKSFGIDWDDWNKMGSRTYILTSGKIDISDIESRIADIERKNVPNQKMKKLSYSLLPLIKIHLHANNIVNYSATGDIKYVYIFSFVALIILLIASTNYMNLSNALSLKRTKEIGIQKVVGANRYQLIRQYLGETFIMTFLALAGALLLVELFLPALNRLAEKSLSVPYSAIGFQLILLVILIVTSTISGLYPAVFISGFQPIKSLRGKSGVGTHNFNLQKGLIIFQFSLSILIIICTIIVITQLSFLRNSNLGYDKENIVCIKINSKIFNQYNAFKNEILRNPYIVSISRSEPMDINIMTKIGGVSWRGKEGDEPFFMYVLHGDNDFAATYKIEMREGRFYSDQFPSDKTNAFVLNEAAIRAMNIQSPVGEDVNIWGRNGKIIGVARDFHFCSLHNIIEPLVIRIPNQNEQQFFYRELSVRLKPNSIHQSLAFLENKWKSFFPSERFNYYFTDENLNTMYLAEQRMSVLFGYFSFLAIFISCLGLYGLTAFTIERKFKDIGVHKVLGATVTQIVLLLSKQYMWWIFISNIFVCPLAYYTMNKWLQNFAYRINMSWWMFALAGTIAIVIAFFAVSWHTFRAATVNPVHALRYE